MEYFVFVVFFLEMEGIPEVGESDGPLEGHEGPHPRDHIAVTIRLHGLPIDDGSDWVGHRRHPRHQGAEQGHVAQDDKARGGKGLCE